ncbi:uncharacterized protein LOC111633281 isoform X2 [Centruroides sculpturatus]|uniref:uncharacterized protein LOC111633281 isoform X2 n=2 Tax=Centruroides sculpturatus TaxID=218467 RepID=UPI000C6CE2A1|nr:uncharacterized protein LOC111633281 isoform X2 [Centruroides sculpturatus]
MKRTMAKMLIYGSHILGPRIKGSARTCAALIMAIYDPWNEPILKKALSDDNFLEELAFFEFLASEPDELLDARIELMIKETNEETALGFCQRCLKYLERISTNDTIQSVFYPLKGCEISEIIAELKRFFLIWLILLLHRKEQLYNIVKEVSNYNCHEGIQLIHIMKSKNVLNSTSATEILINLFLVRDLLYPSNYCCTKELMNLWCEVQIQQERTLGEIKEASYKLLVHHASTSAHFYLFIDCLWEKFGLRFLSLYLEMYIHGLTADLNHLEAARQADDRNAVLEMESHMATIFTKLASLFINHETIAHECILSAFSLEPTQERLELLHKLSQSSNKQTENNVKRKTECICEEICTTPNKEIDASECLSQYQYHHSILDTEIAGIKVDQLKDFVTVLENVRIHYLKFSHSWDEMKQICKDYLETASALRTLFAHTNCYESADSEIDSLSDDELISRTERLTCDNNNKIQNNSILLDKLLNKANGKLPFDLLNRVHSNVFSNGKQKSHHRQRNRKDGNKKKSKSNKNEKKSRLKELQKKKKKKKRKLRREKELEDSSKKSENNCQVIQKIKKKKKKFHKKVREKSDKTNSIQASAETQMGSVDLATMVRNNTGILVSKFHADFAMSSKFCENSSMLTSCLPPSINPIMVLSDLLTQRQASMKKLHKTSNQNKKIKKNKSKIKLKNKLKKLKALKAFKKKHKKDNKKFQKSEDITKNCITSYSMITSGTELLQNTNKSVLLSSKSLTQSNECSLPNTSLEENLSIIESSKNENIPATNSICNTTSSYQTCTAPAIYHQTMPVLMPPSMPHKPSFNANDTPPSLRKETTSNDANNFYVSNAVVKNIAHLNTIGDHTKILAPIREPINNTYTIGETVSTCMLVEKRHTVVSRLNMSGVNKQIVSTNNPTVNFTDEISQTNLNQMTTCIENKPVNQQTVITGTVPNPSVVISPPQTVQNTIPIVTNRTETFQNHSDNIPQNVPTVATLTIPIAPPPQNGAGNRLLAGRLVIPVSLNCTGVKNVFPTSALVQNQPSVVNCNQQPVTIPGVIIVRNNNSNNKDINVGKNDAGKIILPSIPPPKTKKPSQSGRNKNFTQKNRRDSNIINNSLKQIHPTEINSLPSPLPTLQSNVIKNNTNISVVCSSVNSSCHSTNIQSNIQNMLKDKPYHKNSNVIPVATTTTISTTITPTPAVANNSKYLELTKSNCVSSTKSFYPAIDLSYSRTLTVSSTEIPCHQISTQKPQVTWNTVNTCETINTCGTDISVLKTMQKESANTVNCNLTAVTSCSGTTVSDSNMITSITNTTVQQFDNTPELLNTENKCSSSVHHSQERTLQPIITSGRSEVISDGNIENNLLLMEQPNRSLSSISDAVRVSLMVMDDETAGAESQGMQAYPYDTPDNMGYTNQQDNTTAASLCDSFNVTENLEMQQNALIMNGNQTSQLYQSVTSCQMLDSYNSTNSSVQQIQSNNSTTWTNSINTREETEKDDHRKQTCRKSLSNDDTTEEVKKQKRETPKRTKDNSQNQSSSSSSSNRFWCDLCRRGFFSAYNLRRHCKNVHKMELSPVRPITETQNLYQKQEKLPEQQCHELPNSNYEMSRSPLGAQPFPLCGRPQTQEEISSKQNQSVTSNMHHTITELSCVKQNPQKNIPDEHPTEKHRFEPNNHHDQLPSTTSYPTQSLIPSARQFSSTTKHHSAQFSHPQSEFTFQSNSNQLCTQLPPKHSSITSFIQNPPNLCSANNHSAPLSTGTSDSLEDLEQFLMENLSWSSDQGTTQNLQQSTERPASADSLSLPVHVSSSIKPVANKSGMYHYNTKSDYIVGRNQKDTAVQCNNNVDKNTQYNEGMCYASKCSSSTKETVLENKLASDLVTSNEAKMKFCPKNDVKMTVATEKNVAKSHRVKLKSDTNVASDKNDFEKILSLEKLTVCDNVESKTIKDCSIQNKKDNLSNRDGQEKVVNENCLQDTFKDKKSDCAKVDGAEKNVIINDRHETADKMLALSELYEKTEQLKINSEPVNKNFKELEMSRNGSPSALSDISHMLNECRIEKSPKLDDVCKLKGGVSLDKIGLSLGINHDGDGCKSSQADIHESFDEDALKQALINQDSVLSRSDNMYHCKWEKEHYERETNLTRGRTRSRDTGKMLKRVCSCCESSNPLFKKCRKSSSGGIGSNNASIPKVTRSNARKKQANNTTKATINTRSSRRPRTRSTTVS